MKIKKLIENFRFFMRRFAYNLRVFPWIHSILIFVCVLISLSVFYFLWLGCFKTLDIDVTLTNLLTVNAIFSAILITYLFTRITWSKERKHEVFKEAIALSQKITDFRRILNQLTRYYQVWQSDISTKSLLDSSKYKNIDYYDLKLAYSSDYKPKNLKLIQELYEHSNFREGQTTLYLAMTSLVYNKKSPYFQFNEELYNDYEHNGIYNIQIIEKWMNCEIFGSIWYWLDIDSNYINYNAIRNQRNFIVSAAARINKKYENSEINNDLIKNLANDINSHYLKELYFRVKELKKGISSLNLLILVLITISLMFGVLAPFILLIIQKENYVFNNLVGILSAINVGLLTYFIFRFPYLIKQELKWL